MSQDIEQVSILFQRPGTTVVETMVVQGHSTGTVWTYHVNPWRPGQWSVTHKPSQLRCPVDGLTQAGAEKLALVLASSLPKYEEDVEHPTPAQRIAKSLYQVTCLQAEKAAKADSNLSRLRPINQQLHVVLLLSRLREEPNAKRRDAMIAAVHLLIAASGKGGDGSFTGESVKLASEAAAAFELYRDSTRKIAAFAGIL